MNLLALGAEAIARAVRSRSTSAVEITGLAIDAIVATDPKINAFTDRTFDRALNQARAVDGEIAAGRDPGPLAGVPFAVKNLFDIAGLPTRAGSKMRRNASNASEDAALVSSWTRAGGILLGALNMDEFAYGFTTENAHDGPTRNPRDLTRMAGGSSGGSAAAVAAGLVAIAAGSDTNGSIRVPASFCGVFGLKPTYGRLSRRGAFPFVNSLDHVGPFAHNVADLTLAYNAAQGRDARDPAQVARPADPVELESGIDVKDLRVGALGGWFRDFACPESLAAVEKVSAALGAPRRLTWPEAHIARAAAFCITAAEGGALHLPDLKRRPQDFDHATRDRLLAGALMPSAILIKAQRFRSWFRQKVLQSFEALDVLIAPATPSAAPKLGEVMMTMGDQQVAIRPNIGLYTQPVSFIGLPVVAAPIATDEGALPVGVQIIAPPWREDLALKLARHLERAGVAGLPPARLA